MTQKKAKNQKIKIKESDLQNAVLSLLKLKGVFHYRNNSGAFKRDGHFYSFGTKGSPDIICVIGGRFVGLEIKGTDGKQSEDQKKFQKELEKAGGIYVLLRSQRDIDEKLGLSVYHKLIRETKGTKEKKAPTLGEIRDLYNSVY
ncbi:MAG: VRR-NUC domain-containing protein [Patescibacteria group bacterium]|nr:VRR-NUC domain-containing protein [Patescibacteria group bacterium]